MKALWSRDPEAEILLTVRELGIGFVPYTPLGRGFLTGRITSPDDLAHDDFRRHHRRFQGDAFQKNLDLVAEIGAMAKDKGCRPRSLRSPGCWRRATTSCRSPAPSDAAISKTISVRSTSRSTR